MAKPQPNVIIASGVDECNWIYSWRHTGIARISGHMVLPEKGPLLPAAITFGGFQELHRPRRRLPDRNIIPLTSWWSWDIAGREGLPSWYRILQSGVAIHYSSFCLKESCNSGQNTILEHISILKSSIEVRSTNRFASLTLSRLSRQSAEESMTDKSCRRVFFEARTVLLCMMQSRPPIYVARCHPSVCT